MSLDYETAIQLINKAIEEKRDNKIFQQWVAQLPVMGLFKKPISFDEYHAQVLGLNVDNRPTAEILAELDEIEKIFEEG